MCVLLSSFSFGVLDVKIQDQTTEIIDLRLFQTLGNITLLKDYSVGDRYVNISSPDHVPEIGNVLCLKSDDSNAFLQPEILSVLSLGGNNYELFLDQPLDYGFDINDGCAVGNVNWAVDGSVNPVEFSVSPSGNINSTSWDIVRIIWYCEGTGGSTPGDEIPDFTSFFTMDPVTNGAYLRVEDGYKKNIFNVKNNGELVSRMYDLTLIQTINRDGLYSAFARRTFGGQDKNGVTVRLDAETGDKITWVVQDDLTEMSFCKAVVQGHIVDKESKDSVQVEELDLLAEIYRQFFLFLIGAILIYLGYKSDKNNGFFWTIAGGVFWLGSAGVLFFVGNWINSVFYILLGLVAIFIGIGEVVRED